MNRHGLPNLYSYCTEVQQIPGVLFLFYAVIFSSLAPTLPAPITFFFDVDIIRRRDYEWVRAENGKEWTIKSENASLVTGARCTSESVDAETGCERNAGFRPNTNSGFYIHEVKINLGRNT